MATPRTCKDFIDLLIEYVDDELDEQTRSLCEQHMDLCRQCADYLESYMTTTELGQRIYGQDDNAAELPEDLVQSILVAAGVRSEMADEPPSEEPAPS